MKLEPEAAACSIQKHARGRCTRKLMAHTKMLASMGTALKDVTIKRMAELPSALESASEGGVKMQARCMRNHK